MTDLVASAPGKLVLLGEYAVLEGAPALVLAVDRRANVRLRTIDGDAWEIASPTLGLHARIACNADGVRWIGTSAAELDWVARLLERCAHARRGAAYRIDLDSDAFHVDAGGARIKLGLGSSAALTVALLGALHAAGGLPAPTLVECIDAHRAIQHGAGSGVDIATSIAGGLSTFRLDGATAQVKVAQLPEGLHWCCVYSGRPASTTALLATVAAWRARTPAACAQALGELATISGRGIDALAAHDADAFLSCLHDYAHTLAAFGESAGADIASAEHRALGALAASCGCVYKSCGAGGGDVGVGFARSLEAAQDFAARASAAGFRVITLAGDPRGLDVAATT